MYHLKPTACCYGNFWRRGALLGNLGASWDAGCPRLMTKQSTSATYVKFSPFPAGADVYHVLGSTSSRPGSSLDRQSVSVNRSKLSLFIRSMKYFWQQAERGPRCLCVSRGGWGLVIRSMVALSVWLRIISNYTLNSLIILILQFLSFTRFCTLVVWVFFSIPHSRFHEEKKEDWLTTCFCCR